MGYNTYIVNKQRETNMPTTPNDFHTGGINSPHEWNLYVLNNTAQFYFWDTFLDGMAEVSMAEYNNDGYHPPVWKQYANGCFPLIGHREEGSIMNKFHLITNTVYTFSIKRYDIEMPLCYQGLKDERSWAQCNKGKLSKRARRK